MRVGVGYSENPDTAKAGREAAIAALKEADRDEPCDLALLFASSPRDFELLRSAAVEALGSRAPIFGGGTIGAITNDRLGYAGGQVILAAIWLEEVRCQILTLGGLDRDEERVGRQLGLKLAGMGVTAASPLLLFHDSLSRPQGDPRLALAAPLLKGLERGLGFPPNLVGSGLMGDYAGPGARQLTGRGLDRRQAIVLAFSGDIRLDAAIMPGYRPATGYYTVTKADRQVILEINGQPALRFLDRLLGGFIQPRDYPYHLVLGVNRGDKWALFEEDGHTSRLCLGLDQERGGLIMFEPGLVEGAEFQIMYRGLDLDDLPSKVAAAFDNLKGRRPVFATYLNCAGRAGQGLEDAAVIQRELGGRAPLLGLYSGVEIAPVRGRPRSLDGSGVLSLFSVSENP